MEGTNFFEVDRLIAEEANNFLRANPAAINSKELAQFEKELALKLNWRRSH